jgi:hypothetical protein
VRKEVEDVDYGLYVSQSKAGVSNSIKIRLKGLIERKFREEETVQTSDTPKERNQLDTRTQGEGWY